MPSRCWAQGHLPLGIRLHWSVQERWEEPDAEYAASDAADGQKVKRFIPFSHGNRDCAGQSLARINYTTTVAMLLANFSFRLADEVGLPVLLSSSISLYRVFSSNVPITIE